MSGAYEAVSLTTFRLWRRYFRYEVENFDVLRETPTSLIVGYHGGPWTYDLWMLGDRMHEELGYFPRAIWHWLWWAIPGLQQAVTQLGGLRGAPSYEEMDEMRSRGEHLIVAPGGMREAMRPFWSDPRVDLGERRGYVRLALKHDLPIIPVVATGIDDTFLGLNDGYRLSRRLFGRGDLPAWLAVGAGGVWPLALPFPVKIRQRIGEPIRLDELPAADDDERLERAHEHVTTTLQTMLDALRADHPGIR
jgi:1-acyl-sn-glycerol-3-phosphate acyltransferase